MYRLLSNPNGQAAVGQRNRFQVVDGDEQLAAGQAPPWQGLTKYVRVRSRARPGFVEFDFSIGDPNLFLEMILPEVAFEAFCRANDCVHLTPAQAAAVDAAGRRWQHGDLCDPDAD